MSCRLLVLQALLLAACTGEVERGPVDVGKAAPPDVAVLDTTGPLDVGLADGGADTGTTLAGDTLDAGALGGSDAIDAGADVPEDAALLADTIDSGDVPGLSDADGTSPADADALSPDAGVLATIPVGEGLCVAIGNYSGERLETALARLAEAGVKRVRGDLTWAAFEPTKGAFVYSLLDNRVLPYAEKAIAFIAVLAYGNPWATSVEGADGYYPPDDPQDFANYVTAVTEHLAGTVWDYEIWNEENAGYRFWKPNFNGDPVAYGALLKAAVAAGRAACPGCTFAFGGPFFHTMGIDGHIKFLTDAYAAHPDLSLSFDAMGFHPYPFYPPQAAPEGPPPEYEWAFADMVAGVRAVMDANGAPGRPLWTTEVGWPIWGTVDLDRQAAYLVRAVLTLTANSATPVCWYTLFDGKDPLAFPPEQAFGLLTNGDEADGVPQPKPAFRALVQLGNRFAGYRIVRDLAAAKLVPSGVRGFELQDDGTGRVWALYTHPDDGPVPVVVPSVPVAAYDQVGEALTLSGASVPVGFRPVFVVLQ